MLSRKQTISGDQKCLLVDITSYYQSSKLPPDFTKEKGVEFLISPVELQRSLSAIYPASNGIGSQNSYLQYMGSKRNSVSLAGCIIDSRCSDIDLQQYMDQFEQLIFSPPKILALCFSQRIIQPIVLTELSITETAWANGYLSRGTFDLTFEYIQPTNQTPRVSLESKPTKREEAKKQISNPNGRVAGRDANSQAEFTRQINGR